MNSGSPTYMFSLENATKNAGPVLAQQTQNAHLVAISYFSIQLIELAKPALSNSLKSGNCVMLVHNSA